MNLSFLSQIFRRATWACALLLCAALPLAGQAQQGLRLPGSPSAAGSSLGSPAYSGELQDAPALASGNGQASGLQQADHIVALVNSEPITNLDLQRRMQRARAFFAQQGIAPSEAQIRQEALNVLIAERLQLQEARMLGMTIDDYTLEQAERNVAEQNGVSVSAMYRELAAEGISREQFRNQLRDQLTLMRVRERLVDSRVRVSDQELDRFLRDNPIDFGAQTPPAINLGHVLVIVPEDASAEQEAQLRQRIEAAAQALQDGQDFAEVARAFSDAPEGRTGGELGLRPENQYPELFLEATQGQPIGSVVGPIRSGAGFHLLKVLERQEGGAGVVVQNHARHILMTPGSGRSPQEVGQILNEIRDRIVNGGEDFAMLAREYSEDGSAAQGGDLGWAGPGMFVPEFQAVLDALQPGEVSYPVASRFGLHLIQLLERRQARLTQEEMREMVRGHVREQKVNEEYVKWVEGLRARAFIEIRDDEGGF